MQAERKKADPQAVDRHRYSRKHKSQHVAKPRRVMRSTLRAAVGMVRAHREYEIACRLCKRFYRCVPANDDIRSEFEYWRLRKFGYDVLRRCASDRGIGHQSTVWIWWRFELNRSARSKLIEQYPNRLLAEEAEAENRLRKFEKFLFGRL